MIGRSLVSRMFDGMRRRSVRRRTNDAARRLTAEPLEPRRLLSTYSLEQTLPAQTFNSYGAQLGWSLDVDGDYAVAGAPHQWAGGTRGGAAHVYLRNDQTTPDDESDDTWEHQATLVAPDAQLGAQFGDSVAMDGDTIVVGAPLYDDAINEDGGSAYVFTRDGTTWNYQATLVSDDASQPTVFSPGFGQSVAIEGDMAVVGADRGFDGIGYRGAAYVFVRSGATWSQQARLTPSDPHAGSEFGTQTEIDGDTVVVTSPFHFVDGSGEAGAAYVFVRGAGSWSEQAKVVASDAYFGDQFGKSAAIEGDTLVVGAPDSDTVPGTEGIRTGSAYVFTRSGTDWTETSKLTASDAAEEELFGIAVSMSGDTLLIGSRGGEPAPFYSGSVYVFSRDAGVWSEQEQILNPNPADDDGFGSTLAISGNTMLVGAYGEDDFGSASGSAYAFGRHAGPWTPSSTKLSYPNPHVGPYGGGPFGADNTNGRSVAVDGDYMVVGNPLWENGNVYRAGTAYVYMRNDAGSPFDPGDDFWDFQTSLTASDVVDTGEFTVGPSFGSAVAIHGDTIAVGANLAGYDSTNFSYAGAVYVFTRSGTTWTEQAKLVAPGPPDIRTLGDTIDVYGDTLAVSLIDKVSHDYGDDPLPGSVVVFHRQVGVWSEQATLTSSPQQASYFFGHDIDLLADTLVVGDATDDESFENAGAVYEFTRNGGTWSLQNKLTLPGSSGVVFLGREVALNGNTLATTAKLDGDPATDIGVVLIFTRDAAGWAEQAVLTAGDPVDNGEFGSEISIDGDVLAVGGLAITPNVSYHLFTRQGTEWSELQEFTNPDPNPPPLSQFGTQFVVDGHTLAVGDATADNGGVVYIFGPDSLDWGDAPDPYPTLAEDNGPRHALVTGGPRMGLRVDAELNGQPDPLALGDDNHFEDEDGVTFLDPFVVGHDVTVEVDLRESPSGGLVSGWFDYNADGDWDDDGENLFSDIDIPAGQYLSVTFPYPHDAAVGTTYARFRVSTEAGLSYDGEAPDGEVEDYAIEVLAPGEIHGAKWHDLNADGQWDPGEPPLPDWTIYLDLNQNGQLDDGEPTELTDANGEYSFTDLVPGNYTVAEVQQTPWQPTSDFGGLTFEEHIWEGQGAEVSSLGNAVAVAVTPDGRHVYAGASGERALSVFERDLVTGELSFVETHTDRQNGVEGLLGLSSVTVSPDGDHVYAASMTDHAVTVFERNAITGQLNFLQMILTGETNAAGLFGNQVVVSPDGNHVYVGVGADDAIYVFSRDEDTGLLTLVTTYEDDTGGVDGLNGAFTIDISPDGSHLYAGASQDDAVAVFTRDAVTGELAFVEVHRDTGLDWVVDVTVSPDGNHVYATSYRDRAIVVYARDGATGELTFVELIDRTNGAGSGFRWARHLAYSPDGTYVYAADFNAGAVTVFSRDAASGHLTFVEMLEDGQAGVTGLEGVDWVTVAPDGNHVYTTAKISDALAGFARDAGTGQLTFVDAIIDDDGGVNGITGAQELVMSPDGRHAYVAGRFEDVVVIFAQDAATGHLSYVGKVSDGDAQPNVLGGIDCVAVSPDGAHVYAGTLDGALTLFERDAVTGDLTVVELIRDGEGGADYLRGLDSLAVSPDGIFLYAAANQDDAVTVFERDAATGQLTFFQAVRHQADLDGAASLAVSPAGDHLYVAGKYGDTVTLLTRDPADGHLSLDQTIHNDDPGVDGLDTPRSVRVSPDGAHVYVASQGHAVAAFARDPLTGQLTFVESLERSADDIPSLMFAEAVGVSPDGTQVFVASGGTGALAVFDRHDTTGELTLRQEFFANQDGVKGLMGAISVAPSVDGKYVYVAADTEHSVAIFHRDLPGVQRVSVSSGASVEGVNFGNSVEMDFGDAPFPYPTVAINNGARHIVNNGGPLMGATVDVEENGQSDPNALGDDQNFDDENGVTFTSPLVPGHPARVDVDLQHSPADGVLNAWIDFGGDFSWNETGDHVFVDVVLTAGSVHSLDFDVPASAVVAATFARFRISTAEGLAPTGEAPDGEVEDHAVQVVAPAEIRGAKWSDANGNGQWDDGEQPLADWTVYLDLNQNGQLDDGEPTDVTDAYGQYVFTNLVPGQYTVAEVQKVAWHPTSGIGRLTYVDYIREGQGSEVDGLENPYRVAFSPDGRHVYVASSSDRVLSVYARDETTGELTFVESHVDNQNGVDGLGAVTSVVVSPDGKHVYANGRADKAVAVFERHADTGQLRFVETVVIAESNTNGSEPDDLAISPDGSHVYAAVAVENSIVVFSRDAATGRLTRIERYENGVGGMEGIQYVVSLTVSPDGSHLYAASPSDTVAVLERDAATGLLTFVQVLRDGEGGVDGLDRAYCVTVSPEGSHVYAGSLIDRALVVFARDAGTGELTFVELIDNGVVAGFRGARSLDVAPDGNHVYAADYYGDAVSVFSRDPLSGQLTFVEMILDDDPGVTGLDFPYSVTVSPDGNHVYATAKDPGSLVGFSRDMGTGELTFIEAFVDHTGGVNGLDLPHGIAFSPDGHHGYVCGGGENLLGVFSQDAATGQLDFIEALSADDPGLDGITDLEFVTVSPDGNHVYAVSDYHSLIVVFERDVVTGQLTFVQTLRDDQGGFDFLYSVSSLAFGPGGNHVYAAAATDDAVTVFERDPASGQLTLIDSIQDNDALDGAVSVTLSPDGNHLYVAARYANALSVFTRNPADGRLTLVETLRDGQDGVDGLDFARSVTVSPDGSHVYVAGHGDDAVAAFERDPDTGQLTFVEAERVPALDKVMSVTVSLDGSRVYAASLQADSLVVFDRDSDTGALTASQEFVAYQNGVRGLNGATWVTTVPGGKYVYVAAENEHAVSIFHVNQPGEQRVDAAAGQVVEDVDFGNQYLPQYGLGDLIGVHRTRTFFLDVNANGRWDRVTGGDMVYSFGGAGDLPIVGDFNGDGFDEIGVYRPLNQKFYLDFNGNGRWDTIPGGDKVVRLGGTPTDTPIIGDWNGDGTDDVGLHHNRVFLLDYNGNGVWDKPAGGDLLYAFGALGDIPLAGNFGGDRADEIGVYRPSNAKFYLDANGNGVFDGVGPGNDKAYVFKDTVETPITGDWGGDGTDKIGTRSSGLFFEDLNNNGTWDRLAGGDLVHNLGFSTDTPIIGRWKPPEPLMAGTSGVCETPESRGLPKSDEPERLTHEELAPVVRHAVDLWLTAPLSPSQERALSQVDFHIADLPGATLGQALGTTIWIDVNAAGHGWLVGRELRAESGEPDSGAVDTASSIPHSAFRLPHSMDLLSAVMHELGHVLGYDHDDGGLMQEELSPVGSEMNGFGPDAVDALFAAESMS